MKRLVAIASLVVACKGKDPESQVAAPAAKPVPVAADPCAVKAEGGEVMPWIKDNLADALGCASRRKVPVVIDLWAPWCHTCLSMQSTVFTDPSFKPDVERFVFVSLDTDREANAEPVGKYPPSAWPTFYVIGADGAVLARFVGAASVAQFHAFLDAGANAQRGGAAGADARLLGAERALAIKDLATADQELTAALAQAPVEWPRKPDVLTSLIQTKAKRKDWSGCLELAEKSLDDTGNAAAATDFIVNATACVEERAKPEAERVKLLRERMAARLQKLVDDPSAPLSVDDRSDAMANLREVLDALGKPAEAKAVAEHQRTLLDATAAKATTPMAAMTYNWPRAEVYVYLGKPLELVPALERSAKDLPDEYDPRARLGWIYLKAGKLDEAAVWTDQALRMVYGPRKARVLAQRGEIATKQSDKPTERRVREDTVKLWESLPPSQANPDALAKAKAALVALDAGSGT